MNAEVEGFAQFVMARERALQRTAWLLTGDWALAEDLVQTALARSWPRWERIRRRDDPEIYVRRVMVNTWATWSRRRWRRERASEAVLDSPAPGDVAAEVAVRMAVRSALGSLTGRQRAVLVLLDLTEMEPEESLPAVLRGETDVAVGHEYDLLPRPLDPLFERRELLSDPVYLAVRADHPLAAGATVQLSDLAGLPFLAPRSSTSCAEMIQRACARAGFVPTVVARATDFAVLLSLVAVGAGVTLVPALAARSLPPQVRLLTPADPVTRQIFAVSRRGGDRKPAVLDVLAAEAARLAPGAAAAVPIA